MWENDGKERLFKSSSPICRVRMFRKMQMLYDNGIQYEQMVMDSAAVTDTKPKT
jgi:hypothetical protein